MSEPIETKPAPRRTYRQISLRTLLLLTAAVAVWVAHFKNRSDNEHFTEQINTMRPLARELIVVDPSLAAVVKQDEHWYDQNDWKYFLPDGDYRLQIATREIDEKGLAPVTQSVPIKAGMGHVGLEQKRNQNRDWLVTITAEGKEILSFEEPADWDAGRGSSGGGLHSESTQLPPDEPIVLFRRRFMVETMPGGGSYTTPQGPSNGLLLWIEQVDRKE